MTEPDDSTPDNDPDINDDDADRDDPRTVAAREALATPPPALDAITRRRLVRTALAEAGPPTRRRQGFAMRVTGIAAAVVVLALGAFAVVGLTHSSSSNSSKDSGAAGGASGSATTTAAADSGDPSNLSEVGSPTVLLRRALAALRRPGAEAQARARNLDNRCLHAVRYPPDTHPFVLATATFRGAPAVVVVDDDHGRTLIYVLSRADCHVLGSQFIRR